MSDEIPPPSQDHGLYIEANVVTAQDNASYVKFINVALGYPAPYTLCNAVKVGYITGPHQFPRLTTKMIRKNWPNELATARGHHLRHLHMHTRSLLALAGDSMPCRPVRTCAQSHQVSGKVMNYGLNRSHSLPFRDRALFISIIRAPCLKYARRAHGISR